MCIYMFSSIRPVSVSEEGFFIYSANVMKVLEDARDVYIKNCQFFKRLGERIVTPLHFRVGYNYIGGSDGFTTNV